MATASVWTLVGPHGLGVALLLRASAPQLGQHRARACVGASREGLTCQPGPSSVTGVLHLAFLFPWGLK